MAAVSGDLKRIGGQLLGQLNVARHHGSRGRTHHVHPCKRRLLELVYQQRHRLEAAVCFYDVEGADGSPRPVEVRPIEENWVTCVSRPTERFLGLSQLVVKQRWDAERSSHEVQNPDDRGVVTASVRRGIGLLGQAHPSFEAAAERQLVA